MGNFEYDQVKMALLAIQEHDEFQKKLLIHFTEQEALEDARGNDGVARNICDTCGRPLDDDTITGCVNCYVEVN